MNLLDQSHFVIVEDIRDELKQLVPLGLQLAVNVLLQRGDVIINVLVQLLVLLEGDDRAVTALFGTVEGLVYVGVCWFLALLEVLLGVFGDA